MKKDFPILKKHNGIFLTYDDNHKHKEGVKKLEGRAILFGFPSQQDADNWFEDPEYQTLSEHRKRGTKTQFITFIKTLERQWMELPSTYFMKSLDWLDRK